MYGFTPMANSPTYLAPSSVSNILLRRSLSFAEQSTIFPSLKVRLTFSNVNELYSLGVLYVIVPFIEFFTGAV